MSLSEPVRDPQIFLFKAGIGATCPRLDDHDAIIAVYETVPDLESVLSDGSFLCIKYHISLFSHKPTCKYHAPIRCIDHKKPNGLVSLGLKLQFSMIGSGLHQILDLIQLVCTVPKLQLFVILADSHTDQGVV